MPSFTKELEGKIDFVETVVAANINLHQKRRFFKKEYEVNNLGNLSKEEIYFIFKKLEEKSIVKDDAFKPELGKTRFVTIEDFSDNQEEGSEEREINYDLVNQWNFSDNQEEKSNGIETSPFVHQAEAKQLKQKGKEAGPDVV